MDSPTAPPRRSATVHTTATTATTNTAGTTRTSMSDEDAIPDSDLSGTTKILIERLQAYKHMCGYLENYVSATQKVQKSQHKEVEKILKTVSEPLREPHHFDIRPGGVTGLFESLRSNTQGIANTHLETEKNLKTLVLPILERLHDEIKGKSKELKNGASKSTKEVNKARANTQKHIELLGQHAAAFDSAVRGKGEPLHDPYILCRGVYHRLNKQITEENNNLEEILAIQNNFQHFETHILETVQTALNQFLQCMSSQTDRQRAMYAAMVENAQQIPPQFEWLNFYARHDEALINPDTPKRTMSNITFANQDHRATKPLADGNLDRKSRTLVKGYSSGYWAVTPSGFLHGFKDSDDYRHDPSPDITFFLPDSTVGGVDGLKFSVKGKDVSGGKVGNAFAMNTELNFKAHSKGELDRWMNALTCSINPSSTMHSTPTSPTVSRTASIAFPPGSPPPQELPHKQSHSQVASPQAEGTVAPTAPAAAPATNATEEKK